MHFQSVRFLVGLGVVGLLLAGCGSISLVKPTPAADIFDFSSQVTIEQEIAAVDWRLVVEEPQAVRSIDTDRIMIKPTGHEVRYIKGARWSDRVPSLLQGQFVEVFEDSGRLQSIGRDTSGLPADYELKADLRDFQVETFGDGDPRVVLRISLKLVRFPSAEMVSSEVFEERVVLKSMRLRHIVMGFDDAVSAALQRAVPWVVAQGEADYLARNPEAREAEVIALESEEDSEMTDEDLPEVTDGAAE